MRSDLAMRPRSSVLLEGIFDFLFDFNFELIDALSDFALGFFWRSLQPEIVDLRKDAVFPRHPAVAESLAVSFALYSGRIQRRAR